MLLALRIIVGDNQVSRGLGSFKINIFAIARLLTAYFLRIVIWNLLLSNCIEEIQRFEAY